MKHHFIDKWSDGSSRVHNMRPWAKVLISFVTVLFILSVPKGNYLICLAALPLMIYGWYISKVPLILLGGRLMIIAPILIVITLSSIGNLAVIVPIIVRSTMVVATLTLLTATTRFDSILHVLERCGLPSILLKIISFMYRYIFLMTDEAERMMMGFKARRIGKDRRAAFKGMAWLSGTLFLRSFERSDRVYMAMCARGFDGKFKDE